MSIFSSPHQSDLSKLPHKLQVLFAIFCAEQVFHLALEEYKSLCREALDTAKSWVFGDGATIEECKKAADAVYSTITSTYTAVNVTDDIDAIYSTVYAVDTIYNATTDTAALNAYYAATNAANAANNNKQQVVEE